MFYTINNISLFVMDEGRGEPVLLFLHFWGGSSATWNGVTAILKDDFRCISYDHRGWGQSDKPETGYSIREFAADTLGLVNALGLQNYILIGHSMGGKISQYIAAKKPAGLQKLILVAPSPAGPTVLPAEAADGMRNAYTSPERINDTINYVFKAGGISPELKERLAAGMQNHNEHSLLGWTDIALPEDVSAGVDKITVPTLIIAGEDDIVDPPQRLEAEVHAVISGSEMVTVSGVGHLSMLQKPDTIAEHIRAFVKGV